MGNTARNPAADASGATPPAALQTAATPRAATPTGAPPGVSAPPLRKSKLGAILVTGDDALWPQVGRHLLGELTARQLDSIDELTGALPPGEAGVILWDARATAHAADELSRIQLHSARFAIIVLDAADAGRDWASALTGRRIAALVEIPLDEEKLTSAIGVATDEARVRMALPGEPAGTTPLAAPSPKRRTPVPVVTAVIAGAMMVAAVLFVLLRHAETKPAAAPAVAAQPTPGSPAHATVTEDQAEVLIEKAQQAMAERRFIEPSQGSALSLYQEALQRDPSSGEARQGIGRVAEILFARVKSSLDERQLDVALQSLETVRSIDPHDARLTELDARIAGLRAEVGPAQIQAAINAQSFDRAVQLIDEASRAKLVAQPRLSQLRDEVRLRRQESESARLAALITLRLQQDRLVEPPHDSAAFYLAQARTAAPTPASLAQEQEFVKRATPAARHAVDQHRFSDADRLIGELRLNGAATSAIAALEHDMTASHGQPQDKPTPQYAELIRARLTAGSILQPENDCALFYLSALRLADPQNAGLASLTAAVQSQLVERARVALDAGQLEQVDSLVKSAGNLGGSADVAALTDKLLQAKLVRLSATEGPPLVAESALTRLTRLKPVYPPRAESLNLEGWVEVAYIVTTDGSVGQTTILNSSRTGVFETAATQAISHLRYKPYLQDGRAVAVTTKLRVAFRVH